MLCPVMTLLREVFRDYLLPVRGAGVGSQRDAVSSISPCEWRAAPDATLQ